MFNMNDAVANLWQWHGKWMEFELSKQNPPTNETNAKQKLPIVDDGKPMNHERDLRKNREGEKERMNKKTAE